MWNVNEIKNKWICFYVIKYCMSDWLSFQSFYKHDNTVQE